MLNSGYFVEGSGTSGRGPYTAHEIAKMVAEGIVSPDSTIVGPDGENMTCREVQKVAALIGDHKSSTKPPPLPFADSPTPDRLIPTVLRRMLPMGFVVAVAGSLILGGAKSILQQWGNERRKEEANDVRRWQEQSLLKHRGSNFLSPTTAEDADQSQTAPASDEVRDE